MTGRKLRGLMLEVAAALLLLGGVAYLDRQPDLARQVLAWSPHLPVGVTHPAWPWQHRPDPAMHGGATADVTADKGVFTMLNWIVSGADNSPDVNGTYAESGTANGKPFYLHSSGAYKLQWSGAHWQIVFGLSSEAYYGTGANLPCTAWTAGTFGTTPAPTVSAPAGPEVDLAGSAAAQASVPTAALYVEVRFSGDAAAQSAVDNAALDVSREVFFAGSAAGQSSVPTALLYVELTTLDVNFAGSAAAQSSVLAANLYAALSGSLTYSLAHSFTAAEGAVVRARVRVTASAPGIDQGFALQVYDGTYRYDLWVRAAGANVTGEPEVACDNTDYVALELWTRNGTMLAWREDAFLQEGAGVADASTAGVAFGSPGVANSATYDLDDLKLARRA